MIKPTDILATGTQPARARLVGFGTDHAMGAYELRCWTISSMPNTKRPARHLEGVSM